MRLNLKGLQMGLLGLMVLFLAGCAKSQPLNSTLPTEGEGNQALEETQESNSNVSDKTIRMVSSRWEPYEYEENGEAKGIGLELTREAFKRLGYEVKVEFVPFKRATEMIQNGEADVLTDVNRTAEREVYGIFSNEPLLTSYTCLFVNADSAIQFDGDIFKLDAYVFGINRGYTHGTDFDEAVKTKRLKVEEAEDSGQNIQKLMDHRIDIFVENELVVLSNLKKWVC